MWKASLTIVLLLASRFLVAQTSGTGSIEGTVTDATGAVVSGATITAVNGDTGEKTTAVSSGAGAT